jgi:hypothetical protein
MTDVVETTPRRRGRPRKEENHQNAVAQSIEPDNADSLAAENAAMQEQIKYQLKALLQLAEKAGIDPFEHYPQPPRDTTVVEEADTESYRPPGRPKPGMILGKPGDPNAPWVPWRKEDLDSTDTVTFSPMPIPSLVFPITDEEGRQKIKLDVNDLVCWLTVGVPNTTNRLFYNAYMNSYDTWKDLENFKRRGPEIAPWGRVGPDGRPSWYYDPSAASFGMTDDGRYLPRGQNILRDVQTDNPEAL